MGDPPLRVRLLRPMGRYRSIVVAGAWTGAQTLQLPAELAVAAYEAIAAAAATAGTPISCTRDDAPAPADPPR